MTSLIQNLEWSGFALLEYLLSKKSFHKNFKVLDIGGGWGSHASIMKSFGFAAGGPVQLAAGGAMRRDRVPAMLEPGEFVMQRKAVNRIGAQNLSAMNGTGNGMPNISVEVKNEGTPKDAQAQVRPQMDVNKMVVEIVTRDIRNNGPIRKTLRTGAE